MIKFASGSFGYCVFPPLKTKTISTYDKTIVKLNSRSWHKLYKTFNHENIGIRISDHYILLLIDIEYEHIFVVHYIQLTIIVQFINLR